MAKRIGPAALGLLFYAVIAVWLVHGQADSYRRSLRDRRALRLASTTRARAHVVTPAHAEGAPGSTRPEESRPPKADAAPPISTPTPDPTLPRPVPEPYQSPVTLQPLVITGLENAT